MVVVIGKLPVPVSTVEPPDGLSIVIVLAFNPPDWIVIVPEMAVKKTRSLNSFPAIRNDEKFIPPVDVIVTLPVPADHDADVE